MRELIEDSTNHKKDERGNRESEQRKLDQGLVVPHTKCLILSSAVNRVGHHSDKEVNEKQEEEHRGECKCDLHQFFIEELEFCHRITSLFIIS
jgi:hypothetical protein